MIEGFSRRLRELRTERSLRQEQVANMLGVTKSTISAYESGSRQPSLEILIRLADLYRVTTDYLLGQNGSVTVELSELSIREARLIRDLIYCLSERHIDREGGA